MRISGTTASEFTGRTQAAFLAGLPQLAFGFQPVSRLAIGFPARRPRSSIAWRGLDLVVLLSLNTFAHRRCRWTRLSFAHHLFAQMAPGRISLTTRPVPARTTMLDMEPAATSRHYLQPSVRIWTATARTIRGFVLEISDG